MSKSCRRDKYESTRRKFYDELRVWQYEMSTNRRVEISQRIYRAHPVGLVPGIGVNLGIGVGREVDGNGRPYTALKDMAKAAVAVVESSEALRIFLIQVWEMGSEHT